MTGNPEMLHDVVSTPLPSIVNNLKYYESNVRQATLDCILEIMKHGKLLVSELKIVNESFREIP